MSDTPETLEAIEASKSYYFRWPETTVPIKGVTSYTPLETKCMQLERQRDELKNIIERTNAEFFKDGEDGNVCARMLEILQEAK